MHWHARQELQTSSGSAPLTRAGVTHPLRAGMWLSRSKGFAAPPHTAPLSTTRVTHPLGATRASIRPSRSKGLATPPHTAPLSTTGVTHPLGARRASMRPSRSKGFATPSQPIPSTMMEVAQSSGAFYSLSLKGVCNPVSDNVARYDGGDTPPRSAEFGPTQHRALRRGWHTPSEREGSILLIFS